MSTSHCVRCDRDLPVEVFSWIKRTGKLDCWCRPCRNEYQRAWHAKLVKRQKCQSCEQELPVSRFGPDSSECRGCQRQRKQFEREEFQRAKREETERMNRPRRRILVAEP